MFQALDGTSSSPSPSTRMLSSLSPPVSAPFFDMSLGERGFFGNDPKLMMQHSTSIGSVGSVPDASLVVPQIQEPHMQEPAKFVGKFENKFKDSYMRNHKAVNTKNLRCFPVCSENHRDNGFCGNEVVVSWHTEGRSTESTFETYAEFQEAEEQPRFGEGQIVIASQLVNDEEDKNKRRYLMKGETKLQNPNQGSLHFARESKGWHYGWMAGRGNGSHTLHEMRVYLLEKLGGDQYICHLVLHSPTFEVTSRKRQRKKKDDKSDDDDESATASVDKKRPRRSGETSDNKRFSKNDLPPLPATGRGPIPPPTSTAVSGASSGTAYPRQNPIYANPTIPPQGGNFAQNTLDSKRTQQSQGGSSSSMPFAQPSISRQGARTMPGFYYNSHTPQSSTPFMHNPFGMRQNMGGQVQWPFTGPTPPNFPQLGTPPTYIPSTSPQGYLPFSGLSNFPGDYSMLMGGSMQPGNAESDVLDALFPPTPPVSLPQQHMLRSHNSSQLGLSSHLQHPQQHQSHSQQHNPYSQQSQQQQTGSSATATKQQQYMPQSSYQQQIQQVQHQQSQQQQQQQQPYRPTSQPAQ